MMRLATTLSALSLSFALVGCASAPIPLASPAGAKSGQPTLVADATGSDPSPKATAAPLDAPPAPGRNPGDFITYRFTGKMLSGPVTLAEKVLSRDLGRITLEVTFTSKKATEALVVTFTDVPSGRGDVLEVSGLDAEGNRVAKTIAEYEALMSKLAFAADENQELLGSEESPRNIAGTELACRSASYRVIVKGKAATLHTLESSAVAWGDLGGEITGADGVVLYRAEVLSMGRKEVTGDALGVAKNDALSEPR